MNTARFSWFALPLAATALFYGGCVTHIKTSITQNPPPAERFAAFTHFELDRVGIDAPYAGQEDNERARKKIQENVSLKADPLIDGWRQAAPVASKPRTLVITPLITEIKFISGGSRFWAGSLAGSSAVILKVTITEKETGKVIATPIFYAKAAAMGGAWTFGATDNIMLVRIANRLTDYLAANYASAVGGPTGVDSSD
jgi:hypothetical protein